MRMAVLLGVFGEVCADLLAIFGGAAATFGLFIDAD